MKVFNDHKLSIIIYFYFTFVESNADIFELQKLLKCVTNYHQVTQFKSDNFTNVYNQKITTFYNFPNKIYSFTLKNKDIHNISTNVGLKNMYDLEKSLIVFYTSNLNESLSFIDYLVSQLSVR